MEKVESWFDTEKIKEYSEKAVNDLEFTRSDHNQLVKMLYKLKYKKKEKMSDKKNIELINNFNESLQINRKQWNMIIEFLQQILQQMSRTLEEKDLQLSKSLKLNVSLFEELNNLKKKVKIKGSIKKGDYDLSDGSFHIKPPSINFNDFSSFYSASKQSHSDISRPFL